MENEEILKRARDLARRAEQRGVPANTGFLTPAERYALEHDPALRGASMVFSGGYPDAERTMAFFLPDWMEQDGLDLSEHICALHLTAAFGSPGHRDYMGAILGMGVGREWVGDILVDGSEAIALCQPSILRHLLSIDKVGRFGVKAEQIPLEAVPHREKHRGGGGSFPPLAHGDGAADRPRGPESQLCRVSQARRARQGGGRAEPARHGQGPRHGDRRQLPQGAAVRHGGALQIARSLEPRSGLRFL